MSRSPVYHAGAELPPGAMSKAARRIARQIDSWAAVAERIVAELHELHRRHPAAQRLDALLLQYLETLNAARQ